VHALLETCPEGRVRDDGGVPWVPHGTLDVWKGPLGASMSRKRPSRARAAGFARRARRTGDTNRKIIGGLRLSVSNGLSVITDVSNGPFETVSMA
jgi:hypothetical protein